MEMSNVSLFCVVCVTALLWCMCDSIFSTVISFIVEIVFLSMYISIDHLMTQLVYKQDELSSAERLHEIKDKNIKALDRLVELFQNGEDNALERSYRHERRIQELLKNNQLLMNNERELLHTIEELRKINVLLKEAATLFMDNLRDREEEIKQLEEDLTRRHGQCVVCMDAESTHVLTGCGHQCVCAGCAPKINRCCPICREIPDSIFRVFRS